MRLAVLHCTISALAIFSKFDDSFKRTITLAMVQQLIPRRTVLIESDATEGFYLVRSGSVLVHDIALDRADYKSAGQYFGADSLIQNTPRKIVVKVNRTQIPYFRIRT